MKNSLESSAKSIERHCINSGGNFLKFGLRVTKLWNYIRLSVLELPHWQYIVDVAVTIHLKGKHVGKSYPKMVCAIDF